MSKMIIIDVKGRRVWDSRGRPTVEAEITLNDGTVTRAIAPAGASTGHNEALDLRDGGTYLDGWGVSRAVNNVNGEIRDLLLGKDICDQAKLDNELITLDGTKNKSRLGGNAMIAVSMAAFKAAAAIKGLELWDYLNGDKQNLVIPLPEIQIFGGGAHAAGRLDIQDLMVMPVGADTFSEATEWVARIYISAGKIMQARGTFAGIADEGGYWPAFDSNEEALEVLMMAIEKTGLKAGDDIVISLDIAANQFYQDGYYHLSLEKEKLSSDDLHALLGSWIKTFPIASIEDPFAEHEKEAFIKFTAEYGNKVQIIGDDYLVTNKDRILTAAEDRAVNAVLIKVNQAGTITETYEALKAAEKLNWGRIVSARSGESEDTTIAHLSIGWRSGQLKAGSFARSERLAKWNEVLRIEEKNKDRAKYSGRKALNFS